MLTFSMITLHYNKKMCTYSIMGLNTAHGAQGAVQGNFCVAVPILWCQLWFYSVLLEWTPCAVSSIFNVIFKCLSSSITVMKGLIFFKPGPRNVEATHRWNESLVRRATDCKQRLCLRLCRCSYSFWIHSDATYQCNNLSREQTISREPLWR